MYMNFHASSSKAQVIQAASLTIGNIDSQSKRPLSASRLAKENDLVMTTCPLPLSTMPSPRSLLREFAGRKKRSSAMLVDSRTLQSTPRSGSVLIAFFGCVSN